MPYCRRLSFTLFTAILFCMAETVAHPPVENLIRSPLILNQHRGFGKTTDTITDGNATFIDADAGTRDFRLRIRLQDLRVRPLRMADDASGWGMTVRQTDGNEYRITVRQGETDDNGLGTMQAVCADILAPDGTMSTVKRPGHLASAGQHDQLTISRDNGLWNLTVANERIHDFGELPIPAGFRADTIGIFSMQKGALCLKSLSLHVEPEPGDFMSEWSDADALDEHLSRSSDILEGYWGCFDSILETSLLRLGGDYRLAIVKDKGRYLLIYLDGAEKSPAKWEPGMIKGELRPTGFGGIFDLVWIDPDLRLMSSRLKAYTSDSSTTLTLEFPYQQSQIRLRRMESFR